MNNQTKKSETHYVWWMCKDSGKRRLAGVAFYDENFGDYRLKLDFWPNEQYYIRCIGGDDERTSYRLESVHKRDGRFLMRRKVGEGYLTKETEGEIFLNPDPFEKLLVVTLNTKGTLQEVA